MNIFIVAAAQQASADRALVDRLVGIKPEPRRNTPVIVVDEPDNLPEPSLGHVPIEHARFSLEHFGPGHPVSGLPCESIARHMDTVACDWVLIEFGQYAPLACIDFIVKLSRYNYLSNRLRDCNLVFSAPAMSLGVLARTLNASFNNLPADNTAVSQAGQIRRLFIIIHITRVLVSLPLPRGVLQRFHIMFRRIYRRLSGAGR